MKKKSNRGLISLEASLILPFFIVSYLILNYFLLSIYLESNLKKSLTSLTLELANFGQIINDTSLVDFLEKENSMGLMTDLASYFSNKRASVFNNKDNTFAEMKALVNKGLVDKAKGIVYDKILDKLIAKHYPKESYDDGNFFYDGPIELDFNQSRIFDNGDIELIVKYKIPLRGFGFIDLSRKLSQRAFVSTNIEGRELSNGQGEEDKSIWQESNFKRGRFFASYFRENQEGLILKKGQGLDLYQKSINTLSQIHSINIFSKTYSQRKGDYYQVDYEEMRKLLGKFLAELKDNIAKADGTIVLENQQEINLADNPQGQLILVFPEEARDIASFEDQLRGLYPNVKLKIFYMEKAL